MATKTSALTPSGLKTFWIGIKAYIDKGLKKVEETTRPVESDTELDETSENPIQNQAITKALRETVGNIEEVLEKI